MISTRAIRELTQKSQHQQNQNINTVVLLGISQSVPLSGFAVALTAALSKAATAVHVSAKVAAKAVGPELFGGSLSKPGQQAKLASWLSVLESKHRMVVYEADLSLSMWTRQCLRHADLILIVGRSDEQPSLGPVEARLDALSTRAQKELVLLHAADTALPTGTVKWLNIRSGLWRHHHIRCNHDLIPPTRATAARPNVAIATGSPGSIHPDFGRLARRLLGQSVGLVFGGGGAKGAAHLGVIRALEEAGVPIDMVGGVSIGSMVAALYAQETALKGSEIAERFSRMAESMGNWWNLLFDLTYPVVALMTGRNFNRVIEKTLLRGAIEDLWLPYFCITTDATAVQERIHTDGSLWRYVRASMSLTGYLPPMCDPVDGHWLLDGGYVNNLPADAMFKMGADKVIAIDIGGAFSIDTVPFGDAVSGPWILWQRLFGRSGEYPSAEGKHMKGRHFTVQHRWNDAHTLVWVEIVCRNCTTASVHGRRSSAIVKSAA